MGILRSFNAEAICLREVAPSTCICRMRGIRSLACLLALSARSKLTWFKINPSVFLTSTVGMSNQDVGAYIKLLSYSWVNGPLPNNSKVLASIAGKGKMDMITARFFEVNEEGKLCDPRLEASRTEAASILEANRKRTAKACENRWKDSPSRRRDDSVTATEDNDNDKEKKGQEKTGDKKTGDKKTGQAGAPTLPPKPSVTKDEKPSITLVENPSPDKLERGEVFPRIASGQSIQPEGAAQGRPAPNGSSAKRSPETQAAMDRIHGRQ